MPSRSPRRNRGLKVGPGIIAVRRAEPSTLTLKIREPSAYLPLPMRLCKCAWTHNRASPKRQGILAFSMKLIRFDYNGSVHAGLVTAAGVVPVPEMNAKHGTKVPDSVLEIIQTRTENQLNPAGVAAISYANVMPLLPYPVPPKIYCIGLNYKSHAADINAVQPDEPGSFMKPASCMFRPGGDIYLPPADVSNDVDAEGELGVVIGKSCRFVPTDHIKDVIFGYTTTLDLTALDVLRKNPRYLTRAKSIDTFFSFGPVIVTADEVPDVDRVEQRRLVDDGATAIGFHQDERPVQTARASFARNDEIDATV